MGAAFRATFDKPMYLALLKAKVIEAGDHMVRSYPANYGFTTMFQVKLCKHEGRTMMVGKAVGEKELDVADEEYFADLGWAMAEAANQQIEPLYMALD